MCDQLSKRKREEQAKGPKGRNVVPKSLSVFNKPVVNTSTTFPQSNNMGRPGNFHKKDSEGHDLENQDIKKKLVSSKSTNLPAANNQARQVK